MRTFSNSVFHVVTTMSSPRQIFLIRSPYLHHLLSPSHPPRKLALRKLEALTARTRDVHVEGVYPACAVCVDNVVLPNLAATSVPITLRSCLIGSAVNYQSCLQHLRPTNSPLIHPSMRCHLHHIKLRTLFSTIPLLPSLISMMKRNSSMKQPLLHHSNRQLLPSYLLPTLKKISSSMLPPSQRLLGSL